jgi:hypothetical protein
LEPELPWPFEPEPDDPFQPDPEEPEPLDPESSDPQSSDPEPLPPGGTVGAVGAGVVVATVVLVVDVVGGVAAPVVVDDVVVVLLPRPSSSSWAAAGVAKAAVTNARVASPTGMVRERSMRTRSHSGGPARVDREVSHPLFAACHPRHVRPARGRAHPVDPRAAL